MPHLPALDGLRGLAVIGVLLFHGGFAWAKGGYLGVSTFFTLSGFLITNLLVREWDQSRSIRLGTFWARRFKRLMPASLAALVGIAFYGWWLGSPEQLANLRGDLLGALAYVANWRFYFSGTSYGSLFSAPSPVQHFWSLAIEEQFYVVFPLGVFVLLRFAGRRALTAALVLAAVTSVALSFHYSGNADRTYYGTDTRAFELLAGALLAMWWSTARHPAVVGSARAQGSLEARRAQALDRWLAWAITAAGAGALAAVFYAWHRIPQTSPHLARGGFAAHALATAVVIVAVGRPSLLTTALSWRPLRAVGLVSYGLYLYHWPIFLALSPTRVGWSTTPLFALRIAVTIVVALGSYYLLEQPIRRGRVLVAPRRAMAFAGAAIVSVIVVSVVVTLDPPASRIAYANAIVDGKVPAAIDESGSEGPVAPATAQTARTIMVLGDSGTVDATPAIGAVFKAAGATRIIGGASPGFGLSNPEFIWRSSWTGLMAEQKPDLVIMMLGGWDISYQRDHGDAAYASILDEAVAILTTGNTHLLWLSMLPGGTEPERPVDRVYAQLAVRYPGKVAYADIEPALRGPKGDWPRAIINADGTRTLWRKPDAWHLCPAGAERVARAIDAAAANAGWAEVAPAGWEQTSWRNSPVYDDPKGGCVP
jgi:peptidoglycan/LPS O-acetylase OafA/YrhL